MEIDSWNTWAFYLMGEKWDDSLDWLEQQPLSKLRLMGDTLSTHVEKKNAAMKRKH